MTALNRGFFAGRPVVCRPAMLFLIAMLSGLSCLRLSGIQNDPGYIPRETAVPGWKIVSAHFVRGKSPMPQEFADIDSGSVVSVSNAVYSPYPEPEIEVRLCVVEFNHSLEALNFFSLFLWGKKDVVFSGLGRAVFDDGIISVKGRFCTAVFGIVPSMRFVNGTDSIVDAAEKNLPYNESDRMPGYTELFSRGGNSPLFFFSRGIEYLPSLKQCFVRRMVFSGDERHVFFKKLANEEEASIVFMRLISRQSGFSMTMSGGTQVLVRGSDAGIYTAVFSFRDYIAGVMDARSLAEASGIIRTLVEPINITKPVPETRYAD